MRNNEEQPDQDTLHSLDKWAEYNKAIEAIKKQDNKSVKYLLLIACTLYIFNLILMIKAYK